MWHVVGLWKYRCKEPVNEIESNMSLRCGVVRVDQDENMSVSRIQRRRMPIPITHTTGRIVASRHFFTTMPELAARGSRKTTCQGNALPAIEAEWLREH